MTPINPTADFIRVSGQNIAAVGSLQDLAGTGGTLADTSVTFVTAPPITIDLLRQARDLGVPAVWLQPGTYDDDVLALACAPGAFKAVLAGTEGSTQGPEGWCVLVDGERGLEAVGKL